MKTHKIGIIMNGVTGRMGKNQHLLRSIDAIIKQGGVKISPTECIMPDPILVGRNETKLKELRGYRWYYQRKLGGPLDADAYVYYKAASWILRFGEFRTRDDVEKTLRVIQRGLERTGAIVGPPDDEDVEKLRGVRVRQGRCQVS